MYHSTVMGKSRASFFSNFFVAPLGEGGANLEQVDFVKFTKSTSSKIGPTSPGGAPKIREKKRASLLSVTVAWRIN